MLAAWSAIDDACFLSHSLEQFSGFNMHYCSSCGRTSFRVRKLELFVRVLASPAELGTSPLRTQGTYVSYEISEMNGTISIPENVLLYSVAGEHVTCDEFD